MHNYGSYSYSHTAELLLPTTGLRLISKMLFGIIDVRKEPFRGLYIGFSNFWLKFVKVPYWTLRYLLPAWRPRRSGPLHWCIVVNTERYNENLDHECVSVLRVFRPHLSFSLLFILFEATYCAVVSKALSHFMQFKCKGLAACYL